MKTVTSLPNISKHLGVFKGRFYGVMTTCVCVFSCDFVVEETMFHWGCGTLISNWGCDGMQQKAQTDMVTRKGQFCKQFFLFKIYAPNNLERSTPKNHWMEYVKPRNDGMDCWWFVSWLAGVIGIPCHSLLQSSICGYEILKNQYLGKLHPPKFDMDTKENDSISKLESGCCFFSNGSSGVIYITNANNALLQGKSFKVTIHLHCLMSPKVSNLMAPVNCQVPS